MYMIQETGEHMSNFVEKNWDEYLRSMRLQGTYGDHVTLLAAAKLYTVDIAVVQSTGRVVIVSGGETGESCSNLLVLGHATESHYVSLVPKGKSETYIFCIEKFQLTFRYITAINL